MAKKKMELLEELVDEVIQAPIADKPKRTRKPRKKKVKEAVIEAPTPVPPIAVPHPTGESKSIEPEEPPNIYQLPGRTRRHGYPVIGN